ncbi:MAG: glycosyltransferase [Rhodospirillales bacterium]
MSDDYLNLLPALVTAALYCAVTPYLHREENGARTFVSAFTGFLGIRYIVWRLLVTVLPATGTPLQIGWIWFCYGIELAAIIEMLVFLLILSRWDDRRPEADAYEAALAQRAPAQWPSVDVFVPTLNEGFDVLEKTIVGLTQIDYPNFRAWVLDDGRRPWLADYCRRKGVGYLTRDNNKGAKAGNINAALARTSGELVAILDADFVPFRQFLRRTVGFFGDPSIGIVQTPQHFYNRDPIQNNLLLQTVWPDEQRLFFDVMAPGRDAWNAAFCCGSSSVIRRTALAEIGGVPTTSVTEDLLTTLALLRRGYVTRYLNERLSAGLAPETTPAFFIQRQRWARGAIQSLYLPEGPFGRDLPLLQRLLFFPFSWVIQYPVRLMALIVPIVYLGTGLTPMFFTELADLIDYQLPMMMAFCLGLRWLAPHHYVPILSTAAGVFSTFRLLPSILISIVRPFEGHFGVTPKGKLAAGKAFDHQTFGLALAMSLLTAGGLILNTVPEWQPLDTWSFFPVAAAWSILNLIILALVMLICIEAPHNRRAERFTIDDPAELRFGDGRVPCRVECLSLSGTRLRLPTLGALPLGRESLITVSMANVGELPGRIVAVEGEAVRIAFLPLGSSEREGLIIRLFTGACHNTVESVAIPRLLLALIRRAFGAPAAGQPQGTGRPPRAGGEGQSVSV